MDINFPGGVSSSVSSSTGATPNASTSAAQKTNSSTELLQALNLKAGDLINAKVVDSTNLKTTLTEGQLTRLITNQPDLAAKLLSQQNSTFIVSMRADGKLLTALSEFSLLKGQLLQLKVVNGQLLQVLDVKTPALLQFSQVAQEQLRQAVPLQSPPAKLLSTLLWFSTSQRKNLSKEILHSVDQLLRQLPTPKQLSQTDGVKNALLNSGMLLEANLKTAGRKKMSAAQGDEPVSAKDTRAATKTEGKANPDVDLKAALLRLLKQFADLPGQMQQKSSQPKPNAPEESLTYANLKSKASADIPKPLADESKRTAAGSAESLKAALQPSATESVTKKSANEPQQEEKNHAQKPHSPNTDPATTKEQTLVGLQKQLVESLSRSLIHQLITLNKQQGLSQETPAPNFFQTEIPIFNGHSIDTVLIRIDERESSPQSQQTTDKIREWVLTLSFDLDFLGEMHAQVKLVEDQVSARFWAEKTETLEKIKQNYSYLTNSLADAGIKVKALECCAGPPPAINAALDYTLVDIQT